MALVIRIQKNKKAGTYVKMPAFNREGDVGFDSSFSIFMCKLRMTIPVSLSLFRNTFDGRNEK